MGLSNDYQSIVQLGMDSPLGPQPPPLRPQFVPPCGLRGERGKLGGRKMKKLGLRRRGGRKFVGSKVCVIRALINVKIRDELPKTTN